MIIFIICLIYLSTMLLFTAIIEEEEINSNKYDKPNKKDDFLTLFITMVCFMPFFIIYMIFHLLIKIITFIPNKIKSRRD